MKYEFQKNYGGYFARVLDEADERHGAWVDGALAGIMFRQAEEIYDGWPRWSCRDCGVMVFAGRREAQKHNTVFVELYKTQRCMPCAVKAENDVLEQERVE